jgi:hypothetical protein
VAHVKAGDISAIAEITLPMSPAQPVQPRFDPSKQTYTVVSPNRNLRIGGLFNAPAPRRLMSRAVIGFTVLAALSGRYRTWSRWRRIGDSNS